MNTRLTTAALAVLVSTIALGACGTTSVDDAEPQAPAVNYSDAPSALDSAPTKVPAYARSFSPDGGLTHPMPANRFKRFE